ncbi:MAG: DNA polymerase Y family protein, partial [Sphingobacteriales bacterium]
MGSRSFPAYPEITSIGIRSSSNRLGMGQRYLCIWFSHLMTDWLVLRRPELKNVPFVVAAPDHGRLIITAANHLAYDHGIFPGMASADAKALIPQLKVIDAIPGKQERLLKALAIWCIRYTPIVAVQSPDGLLLSAEGCAHLWGGEAGYLKEIYDRLTNNGYHVQVAMADTIGAAWAMSRFGLNITLVESGKHSQALLDLPPAALRLEQPLVLKLQKLGFRHIKSFIHIQRSALRRRFGTSLLERLDQALGSEIESFIPVSPPEPFHERLPCLEPVRTAAGIEIAIQKLLEALCKRMQKEGVGVRSAILKCYRLDGKLEQVKIGTGVASCSPAHLFKLFEPKLETIEPDLGIELFLLEADRVEDL